jgi:hypothetical protein
MAGVYGKSKERNDRLGGIQIVSRHVQAHRGDLQFELQVLFLFEKEGALSPRVQGDHER